ncbi:hypothetical protein NSK_001368 [Nannochloropsis salina CCMP1776]|uniref:Cytochrome c domain-containing protein n=1 Tax=Nannochloropsis salina CCMP1776 TaxID=1027361 RepID=A0A4D9D7N6_9STRA|nr:hypothetical protein NSK_001368 [Nannochloropsis salina CCMP1776]|eukprot:TFJ87034.1 hypothetical protein NSK_001368 [Nannochloropsis salina CCMP1776]
MALRRCLPKSTAVLAVVGLLSMCLSHSTAFILPARTPQPPKATSITSSSKSLAPSRTDSISRNQVKWYRVASVLALILLPNTHNSPAHAFDAKGARLFENNCASCHVAGTNIIGYARGKTLKEEALSKYKFNTRASIVNLLTEGKGVMPKYSSYTRKNGDVVPAKLTEQEMEQVADYVLEQAKAGWK